MRYFALNFSLCGDWGLRGKSAKRWGAFLGEHPAAEELMMHPTWRRSGFVLFEGDDGLWKWKLCDG